MTKFAASPSSADFKYIFATPRLNSDSQFYIFVDPQDQVQPPLTSRHKRSTYDDSVASFEQPSVYDKNQVSIMVEGAPRHITKQMLLNCNVIRRPNNNVVTIAVSSKRSSSPV